MTKITLFSILCVFTYSSSYGQLGKLGKLQNLQKYANVDDGISSPFHKKNVGKIVFSTSEVLKGEEKPSQISTQFTQSDPVYCRVYLPKSLVNSVRKLPSAITQDVGVIASRSLWKVEFVLDGKHRHSSTLGDLNAFSDDEKTKWTTFRGAMKADDGKFYLGLREYAAFVMKYLDYFTEGEHTVQVNLTGYYQTEESKDGVIASGEFKLTVNGSMVDPNDGALCIPKAAILNAEAEGLATSAFSKEVLADGATAVPYKVKVMDRDWALERAEFTGRILRRSINVIIAYKTKDGKCVYARYVLKQEYAGLEFMKEASLSPIRSSNWSFISEIPCECFVE